MEQKLNDKQMAEAVSFLYEYKSLNENIEEVESEIAKLRAQSESIINSLDSLRKSERDWAKTNAKEMNITETEFINLCKNCM